jgi:hypothetical protein
MTPSEVISAEAIKNGFDPTILNSVIQTMLLKRTAIMMFANSTVLLLISMGNGNFAAKFITQDAPLTFADSLKKFVGQIKKVRNIISVYGDNKEEGIIKMLQKMGVKVNNAGKEGYNWEVNFHSRKNGGNI